MPDTAMIQELKKQKLRIKEQLQPRLSPAHANRRESRPVISTRFCSFDCGHAFP